MRDKQTLIRDFSKNLRILAVGASGSGKTYFAHTFPKTYTIVTEPGGMDTVTCKPELLKNVSGYELFIPENKADIGAKLKALKEEIKEVKELAKNGKIETVVLDNITYLTETVWQYYSQVKPTMTKQGEFDKFAAFRELDVWLQQFVVYDLLSLPCHVIITCHEKLESDEAMDRKVDKTTPIVPNILGGFRDKLPGMMSIVMFLNKIEKGGQYNYWCRTNRGGQKNAKSRIPLPSTIQNISYDSIMSEIKKATNQNDGHSVK